MKVLYVFNHPAPYRMNFFNELGKSLDLHVIIERHGEANRGRNFYFFDSQDTHFTFEYLKHPLTFGKMNSLSWQVIKHLKKNHYDIVVMEGYATITEMLTIRYLKKKRIPYVLEVNGGFKKEGESRLKKALKTKYIQGANYYLSPNQNSNEYLVYYGAQKERISNYPYSSIFAHEVQKSMANSDERKDLKKQYHLDPDAQYLISVGEYCERKNFTQLIDIFSHLQKDRPQLQLLIIGDGQLKKQYQQQIRSLGLEACVHLLPFQNKRDLLNYYRLADLFIFLSKEDNYGHVVNEAMSQGLPVVSANKVNAGLHLIENGTNGYIVDLKDSALITTTIIEALQKPEMGNNALKTSRQNTIETMTQAHLDFFEKFQNH